ncbi:hypothetical protein OCEANICA350_10305 [Oceanicaulis sp. 350]|nr:hypothetical protein OCEANICA350_10305 [Oceanicaulis sp. 350]
MGLVRQAGQCVAATLLHCYFSAPRLLDASARHKHYKNGDGDDAAQASGGQLEDERSGQGPRLSKGSV